MQYIFETIGESAFESGYSSDIMIGDNCRINDTSGAVYFCYGNLEKIKLFGEIE